MNTSRLLLRSSAVQKRLLSTNARRTAIYRPALDLTTCRVQTAAYKIQRNGPSLFFITRELSTEPVTQHGVPTGPPPGFNIEEAKKPLSAETLERPKKTDNDVLKPLHEAQAKDVRAREAVESDMSKANTNAIAIADGKELSTKKEAEPKLTIWQKVKHGVQHFWDGTKLLGVEIKISRNLALKMAAGYELSRREHRQLERTVKDLGRLVPFSVFIIVPAGELFLPIALRLFPNLLPSTYEDQKQRDAKSNKLRSTRKDVSEFLRTTLKEGGIPLSLKTRQREEFTEFFKKIRISGESPTRDELIKVCKIFRDDVTLDNLSRPQLVAMCRYMNLNSFGTDAMLRYNIRHRLRQLKRDDRAISFEGVDSLNVSELQNACASRGIRTHGVSPGRLRDDLNTWLELRLKHGLPSTLLILSNAFMYSQGMETELDSHYDALQAVLSSIPEELYHEIELEIHSAEGAATNKQRLEVLREQQELIDDENEQRSEDDAARVAPYYDRDIDEKIADAVEAKPHSEIGSTEGKDSNIVLEKAEVEKESQKTV